MKRRALAVLLAIFFFVCILAVIVLGESGAFMDSYAEDIDRFMESRRDFVGAPGLAAGIVSGDGLVWDGYYGTRDGKRPVSEDTLFMVASVSKTVVAAAGMQLWEQGRFDLDDDIVGYLDFPVRNPLHPAARITFRHLMTHRSSIADREPLYTRMYTIEEGGDSPWELGAFLKAYLAPGGAFYDGDNYLREAPGSRFEYSNYGTALLAYLVERICGQKFSAYCRDHVFQPLGMDRTYFLCGDIPESEAVVAYPFVSGSPVPPYGYPDYPAGSLKTTVGDLAKFASFFLSKGRDRASAILEPRTIETMFGEYGESTDLGERAMGLLWVHMNWIFLNAIGHTGSDPGVSAFMLLYPDEGIAVLLVMNTNPFTEGNPVKLITQRGILERLYREGLARTATAGVGK